MSYVLDVPYRTIDVLNMPASCSRLVSTIIIILRYIAATVRVDSMDVRGVKHTSSAYKKLSLLADVDDDVISCFSLSRHHCPVTRGNDVNHYDVTVYTPPSPYVILRVNTRLLGHRGAD